MTEIEIIPPVSVGKLHRLSEVRQEMARVYRDARRGQLDPGTMAKFIYALDRIGRVIEIEQIESRILALEERPD